MPFTYERCSICGAKVHSANLREHFAWHVREGVAPEVVRAERDRLAQRWRPQRRAGA